MGVSVLIISKGRRRTMTKEGEFEIHIIIGKLKSSGGSPLIFENDYFTKSVFYTYVQ
jgi:hypothetical protein